MSPLPNFLPITEISLYAQPWNVQLVLDSGPSREGDLLIHPTDEETEAMTSLSHTACYTDRTSPEGPSRPLCTVTTYIS